MSKYPNAVMNAQDGAKHPPLSSQYQALEIEFFIGDNPFDSVYYLRHGKVVDFNLKNAASEPVDQILIDDVWAYIEADGEVLLDRLGGFILPPIPKEQVAQAIAKASGVEDNG